MPKNKLSQTKCNQDKFCPTTFCLHRVLSDGIYPGAFPVVFCLHCVFSCGILSALRFFPVAFCLHCGQTDHPSAASVEKSKGPRYLKGKFGQKFPMDMLK